MLDNLAKRIGSAQFKRPSLYITVLIIVLLFTLPGAVFLPGNIEPSIEKLMPSQTSEVKLMNEMREQFGADMVYIVLQAQGPAYDVRSSSSLEYIDILTQRVLYNEHVLQTRSLSSVITSATNDTLPSDEYVIKEILANEMISVQAKDFLDDNFQTTYIEVTTDTGANAAVIKEVLESIEQDISLVEEFNPGFSVRVTGFGTIDKATFEVIITDFKNITGLSFLAMLGFLFFYFKKSLKKTLLSVSVIMFSLLITMGLTGYLDFTITVMTMVAAAMIMALGISYGIHVVHTYYLLRTNHGKKETAVLLQQNLLRALIGSSLTTSAGFLALLFGVLPAMKILGIVLAIGIIVTLIVTVYFLPPLLLVFDRTKKKSSSGMRIVRG